MNILFLGDVVGAAGRKIVLEKLPSLKEKYQIDFTILNGENSAHGKGITRKIYNSFIQAGVDVITMGNHTFSKGDIKDYIDELCCMVRPANMTPRHIGNDALVVMCKGLRVGVYNPSGAVFMDNVEEDPFVCMEHLLEQFPADIHFVDFHAEATAEKIAMMRYFKQQVEVVVGTHTHVQTADEMIVDGCAYISDVGMCGAYESVLGRDVDETLARVVRHENTRYTIAEGDAILCGVVVQIDETTKRATAITRLQIRPE